MHFTFAQYVTRERFVTYVTHQVRANVKDGCAATFRVARRMCERLTHLIEKEVIRKAECVDCWITSPVSSKDSGILSRHNLVSSYYQRR